MARVINSTSELAGPLRLAPLVHVVGDAGPYGRTSTREPCLVLQGEDHQLVLISVMSPPLSSEGNPWYSELECCSS